MQNIFSFVLIQIAQKTNMFIFYFLPVDNTRYSFLPRFPALEYTPALQAPKEKTKENSLVLEKKERQVMEVWQQQSPTQS